MRFIDRLSLRSRFLVAPAIGVVCAILIYASSHYVLQSQSARLNELHEKNFPIISKISQLTLLLANNHAKLDALLYEAKDTSNEQENYLKGRVIVDELYELHNKFESVIDSSTILNEQQRSIFVEIERELDLYMKFTLKVIELSSDSPNIAHLKITETGAVLERLNNAFLTLSDYYLEDIQKQSHAQQKSLFEQNLVLLAFFILIAFMIYAAIYFSRKMSIDISTINRALISLSNGDRSISIPEHRGTYMQQLSSALLKFKESLIENEYHQHELEKAMIEVTNSNERYYNLLDTMATAVIAIDYKQQIVLFNKAAERVFGYQSNEIIGHSINKLIPRMHHKSHEKLVEDFVGSKEQILNAMARSPVSALRKNGEVFKIEASINKLNLASGKLVTVSINDISARLKAEEKIVHQAHYDALTDLPNRFLALDRLRSKIKDVERDGQQGALLFLDLDDFKKVNDSLGHDTGDKILVEAAKRLKSAIRATDTVGRLGGDEFLVVLSGLQGVSDVQTIVDNIIQLFRRSFQIEGRELILTVSVGITLFPTDADTPEDLLRNADSAMYNAKALGRNTFSYYTAAMNKEVSRRLELEEQMHGALERKEFYVLYQPQYSIQSREIVGVEALLRWNNPSLGEVSPAEFIPIAEHTGQISFLGNYVLDEALNNAGAWLEFYDNFCIAINLSPCQFRDPNLLKDITNTIQEAGIPPKALELEITEGVLLSGYSHVRDAMFALNELGVGLAMDDFGTGYSSLSYLRKYPFDTLKVDRSFIQDITVDPADWQLVRTTIAMAHGLGLKVIAEGVETEEQLTKLSSKNCDIAQGYYFSKPTSAEEITRILSQS